MYSCGFSTVPVSKEERSYYNLPMIKRIYIEITNICDLHCPFCTRTVRPSASMTPSFFHDILRQAVTVTPHIYLHVQGEPLLHPQFDEILSICDKEHAVVHLVTNGSFLDAHPDLLAHSSLSGIAVSLQSVSARPSERIPAYYESVMKLAGNASQHGSVNVDLRFWRSDGLLEPNTAWCLTHLRDSYEFMPTARKNSFRILPHVYVSFANDFTWPSAGDADSSEGTCLGGRTQIAILSDGTAVPCCLDSDGLIPLGSLKTETLALIMKKPRYLSLVQGFEQHRITESLCRKCTFRRRFDH